MAQDDRLRIAVFIDFDNIEIGVKNSLGVSFDAGLVLEALKERGEVVSKTAYSDWQRAGGYSRMLTQHAIKMVQRNLTPGGDKNGADINLALDALEMAFTHAHINAFVIVGGDSDFISLVEKLKQYDKKVFIVGGRQFTSGILQRNCHEFIAYEHLMGGSGVASGTTTARRSADRAARMDRTPIEQAIPLVTRALKVLSERDVSPQLGLLKTILIQLDSTFSERAYGASSFRDFAQKLERAGVLTVQQVKGGWVVAAAEGSGASAPASGESGDETTAAAGSAAPASGANGHASADATSEHRHAPANESAPPAVVGTAAEGVRELARLLATASIRRWPMYLRNVKQVLRQTSGAFDERAYGFSNLMDLLRAAQKEGLVRVDRDRQGVVRIFQGPAFAVAPAPVAGDAEEQAIEAEIEEMADGVASAADSGDIVSDVELSEPVIIAEVVEASPAVVVVETMEDGEPDDAIGNVAGPAATSASHRRRPRRGGTGRARAAKGRRAKS